jgi:puromycin-sensitive aminopeptidase
MDTFILQGGHPLVTLDGHELRQQPFAYGPVPAGTESAIGTTWNVPVAVRALPDGGRPGAPVRRLVLREAPATVPEVDQGIAVVNAGGWGVFRVGYATAHRLSLAEHLAELTSLERADLLGDTWATTLAGLTEFKECLAVAAKLGLEADPAPWNAVAAALNLCNRIVGTDDRAALHDAVGALVGPLHGRLGFEAIAGEGERTPTLRALAINLLGTIGANEGVRAEAARRFDASPIAGGTTPIPADIEMATLAVVAQLLRAGDYDAVLARYRSASTPQEEMRSLGALATFPDVDLCLQTFDLAMTEVRSQNGFAVLGALLANPVGCQAVWTRLTERWDAVIERFPKNAPVRILESLPALCGDAGFAESAIAFLAGHPLASGPRRVAQSIERLQVNVAFAARERGELSQVLATVTQPT